MDKVVATSVAADLAERTNLPVALNAANLSTSLTVKSELAQASSTTSAKPQIISADSSLSRIVQTYTVKRGDTVPSVAAQFGVTTDTIRWANGLPDSDALTAGQKLKILPTSGIMYTVKSGDTLQSIADKFATSSDRIKTYNNLEIIGVKTGGALIIPDGVKPAPAPAVAPLQTGDLGGSVLRRGIGGTTGNGYAFGNCTYYVYERRMQLGMPVGSNWGNANTWAINARAAGYRVDGTPSTGAVLVDTAGYFGHVAVVERVKRNGDIVITEMNNYAYGGFNIVDQRTISAGQASAYQYIH